MLVECLAVLRALGLGVSLVHLAKKNSVSCSRRGFAVE